MDRDDFIITVYCLVCDQYQTLFSEHPLRHGGFTPQLTDEEVITLEVCGEYFKLNTDQDLFDYFRQRYPAWFPRLRDRSLFVWQAANLWQAKAAIQQRLTVVSGQATALVQIFDTLPLPVCVFTRSRRDRCLPMSPPQAGWAGAQARRRLWALRRQKADLLRLQTRSARLARGHDYAFPLLPARLHDIQFLDELVEHFVGLVPADKGFIDEFSSGPPGRARRDGDYSASQTDDSAALSPLAGVCI